MKLFRRSEPLRPDVAAAVERLGGLAAASPELADAIAIQRAILRAIYRDPPVGAAVDIAPERAAEKLRNGVPLLRGEYVPLDLSAVEALLLRLCRIMREHGEPAGAAAEIEAALRQQVLVVPDLTSAVLRGEVGAIREQAGALGLDGGLLGTLLRFSLLPALEQQAAQLESLRAAAPWGRGYCPTCGSWPLLGEYRGLEQTRVLRCGLCATGWAVDRLLCPFCGNRDHEDLGYLYAEGDENRRAGSCERCHGYVKMLATLSAIAPAELLVHDLATLHLDMIALERGYSVPM
jgi:FdhE protein